MATFAPDVSRPGAHLPRPRSLSGLGFALGSAASFGLSGSLARGLLDTGWSPGAVTLVRVALAAVLVAPFGLVSLRGRWHLLGSNLTTMLLYGALAVAGAQFCYFSAIGHMQVGPALLIEYTAPATVVVWLWLRHGQRPGPVTLGGAALAAAGLVLVLDLLAGADLSLVGVLWALGAMVGASAYFLISADEQGGLPPLALASGGLVVGSAVLGLLGLLRLLPMDTATASPTYAGATTAWWLPVLALGTVTAALAYTTGIAAARRLGSRLASFVALLEVVAGVGFAWLLLGQLPRTVQLLGGLLVLAGVVAVKVGEGGVAAPAPSTATADPSGGGALR